MILVSPTGGVEPVPWCGSHRRSQRRWVPVSTQSVLLPKSIADSVQTGYDGAKIYKYTYRVRPVGRLLATVRGCRGRTKRSGAGQCGGRQNSVTVVTLQLVTVRRSTAFLFSSVPVSYLTVGPYRRVVRAPFERGRRFPPNHFYDVSLDR